MYKVIDYKYTVVPIIVLNKVMIEKTVCLTVAIETNDKKNWMAFRAVLPIRTLSAKQIEAGYMNGVIRYGTCLQEGEARMYFPDLSDLIYSRKHVRRKCHKCKRKRWEIFMLKDFKKEGAKLWKWKCAQNCTSKYGFHLDDILQEMRKAEWKIKRIRRSERKIIIPLIAGENMVCPEDLKITEISDGILTMMKKLDNELYKLKKKK